MHRYFIKIPWWIRTIFSSYVWRIPTKDKVVYLSFDDGPHPVITPWVLDELRKNKAKASFFCIGNNVVKHNEVYQQIIREGHAIGNHTFHHLNGWKTTEEKYLNDVSKAAEVIESDLFRPPYGRITRKQAKGLKKAMQRENVKVIMWDVLSADFDKNITPDQCVKNVIRNVSPGAVVVFHDSEKAYDNLKFALPVVLTALANEGYRFDEIIMD